MKTSYIQLIATLVLFGSCLTLNYMVSQYRDLSKKQAKILDAALASLDHCSRGGTVATRLTPKESP